MSDPLRHDVLSRLSHELKTPLTCIMGFAEMLLQPEQLGPAEIQEFAREIHAAARQLHLISEDMVTLARMEAGTLAYDLRPTDVVALVREVAHEYEEECRQRGTELALELQPLVPLRADQEKLEQVLRSLLRNAMEATPQGGRIVLKSEEDLDECRVCLRDTGKGLEPEELEAIFEKFVQAEDILHHHHGLGLGLALSRRIIEDGHRGRISATSGGRGQGAEFTIHLPR